MKLSNFQLERTEGKSLSDRVFVATVDVTTGIFKKKVVRREIRRKYAGFWHFADTGKFTPLDYAERLARAWKAKTGEEC
jgi:hypothetical protein